jgi:hypothetical protein
MRARLPVPLGAGIGITVDEDAVDELSERYLRDGGFAQVMERAET